MSSIYSPSRPCRLSQVARWDAECDVIVVGFGISGACAAIEAATAGAEVTIFETAAGHGGSAALSGGDIYLGGNGGTSVQRAAGFEDTTEDFYKYLLMAGGPGADEAKVRLYVDNALAHFDWLKAQGIPYKGTYLPGKWWEPHTDDTLIWSGSEAAWPFSEKAKPVPRGHAAQAVGIGAGGKLLMDKLAERVASLGIETHFSTRVRALVADEENAVHGVVVRIDNEPRFYRARKGVILCAGGFICNSEMLRCFAPDAYAAGGNPVSAGNDDGSGIRMGMSVGGAVTHMEQFFTMKLTYPPEKLVKGIFVNERGQRFINEDAYHGRVTSYILRQPNGKAWLLMDNAIFGRPMGFRDVLIAAVGETWSEVEEALKIPAGELVHTVDAYNRYAAAGLDPVLHKDAKWMQPLVESPFAALSYCAADFPTNSFTLGGLITLPTGQVVNPEGTVIPGLYAAGRTVCGLPRWGEGYSSGMSLGDSSFFGRQAGMHAATRES